MMKTDKVNKDQVVAIANTSPKLYERAVMALSKAIERAEEQGKIVPYRKRLLLQQLLGSSQFYEGSNRLRLRVQEMMGQRERKPRSSGKGLRMAPMPGSEMQGIEQRRSR
jgi:hypothetical protein